MRWLGRDWAAWSAAVAPWLRERSDEARVAAMLLTRLPMGQVAVAPAMAATVWAYPLVGAAVGALAGLGFALALALGQSQAVAAVLAIAVSVVATGGLHEDGLADFADGFGGGADRARKLEIMADSRIGSYGALALILAVLARWGFWEQITGGAAAVAVGAGLGALSRAPVPLAMYAMPMARPEGLGARAAAEIDPRRAGWALALGLALAWITLPAALAVVLAVGTGAVTVGLLARWQIGGASGDVFGAMIVIAELGGWAALSALGAL